MHSVGGLALCHHVAPHRATGVATMTKSHQLPLQAVVADLASERQSDEEQMLFCSSCSSTSPTPELVARHSDNGQGLIRALTVERAFLL